MNTIKDAGILIDAVTNPDGLTHGELTLQRDRERAKNSVGAVLDYLIELACASLNPYEPKNEQYLALLQSAKSVYHSID